MSLPDVDAQQIAALIEGRLPPDEREKVLAVIDASPEWREVYADALAAAGVTMPAPTGRVDRSRFLPRLTPLQWLEVAAAAAVVIAITPTLIRRLGTPSVPDSTRLLASISLSDSVASTILSQPIWGVTRGDAEGNLAPDAGAIRLGAAVASYEFRLRRGDSSAAGSALAVATLLETYPGGSVAANAYRALAVGAPADADVDAAARLAEQLAGPRPVQLGAWLQGARFAAAAGDTAWFAGKNPANVSRAAIAMDGRAETASAARQFQQIATERPVDLPALGPAVDELLRLLGAR